MEERIEQIIQELIGEEVENLSEYDLMEDGILDSLSFILLTEKLEDEFGVEIQPTRVTPDTWNSVKKIAEYVENLI